MSWRAQLVSFLGGLPWFLIVTLRRGQGGEHRQSPNPLGEGDEGQPHQADPAQTAGFDKMAATGVYSIPIDASGADALPPTPFHGPSIPKIRGPWPGSK